MIGTWLTPNAAEAAFSPEHIARIQHRRYLLAEAWALHLKADVDTPEGERLATLCGRQIALLSNPDFI